MTDGDHELRALYDAARAQEAPTLEDRRAVRRAVLGGAAAGTAAAATMTVTSAAKANALLGATAVATKAVTLGKIAAWVGVGFALGAVTSTGVVVVSSRSEPSAEPGRVVVAPAPRAPAAAGRARAPNHVAPSPRDVAPSPDRAAATPIPPPPEPAVRERAASAPSSPAGQRSLALEARALAEVQRALAAGESKRALALLAEQEETFRGGELREERAAARAVALCSLGDVRAAEQARSRFAATYPRSPLLKRVLTSCGGANQ